MGVTSKPHYREIDLLPSGNLDLVIALDTALAHLAGALGSPAWLLAAQAARPALAARVRGQPLVSIAAAVPAAPVPATGKRWVRRVRAALKADDEGGIDTGVGEIVVLEQQRLHP
jgi:hypothetical protein